MNGCCPQKESLKVEILAESAIISQFSMGGEKKARPTDYTPFKQNRKKNEGKNEN